MPEDWWYPRGYVHGCDYFYGKSKWALSQGAKSNVTAEDIAKACSYCADRINGYGPSCQVHFFIR